LQSTHWPTSYAGMGQQHNRYVACNMVHSRYQYSN
jgi:hypothetical protein